MYRFKSHLKTFPPASLNIGSRCGCGRIYAPQVIEAGQPLGDLKVFTDEYIDDHYEIKDVNGDGRADVDDMKKIGSIYPSWILGMQHTIKWGKISAHIRFRGAFGHYLVSESRLQYEVRSNINNYNLIYSKYFDTRPNTRNVFSDRFAEKSSYLQLDQLFFSYDLGGLTSTLFEEFHIFFGGDNLLTLSGFTGVDPEVRYDGIRYGADGSVDEYQNQNYQSLGGGFESLYTYPTIRSWYVGLGINF